MLTQQEAIDIAYSAINLHCNDITIDQISEIFEDDEFYTDIEVKERIKEFLYMMDELTFDIETQVDNLELI